MHTIKLKVEDEIFDHLIFLLKSLRPKGVVIEDETSTNEESIDFSLYKIDAFKKIKDPLKWQNDMREEWR